MLQDNVADRSKGISHLDLPILTCVATSDMRGSGNYSKLWRMQTTAGSTAASTSKFRRKHEKGKLEGHALTSSTCACLTAQRTALNCGPSALQFHPYQPCKDFLVSFQPLRASSSAVHPNAAGSLTLHRLPPVLRPPGSSTPPTNGALHHHIYRPAPSLAPSHPFRTPPRQP